jgi:hypothetical protein
MDFIAQQHGKDRKGSRPPHGKPVIRPQKAWWMTAFGVPIAIRYSAKVKNPTTEGQKPNSGRSNFGGHLVGKSVGIWWATRPKNRQK